MRYWGLVLGGCLLLVLCGWGCDSQTPPARSVSLAKRSVLPQPKAKEDALRVAVAAMVSPEEGRIYYKQLLDYLAVKTQLPMSLVQRRTYAEVNQMLAGHELDLAFVCSGAYVEGAARGEQRLLVAPMVDGETVYYSFIIVPAASPARSFADLRHSRFAFTDPMSNSGKRAPTALLATMGETPDTFFRQYRFTFSHDHSIHAVARGLVDGAAVDSLVYTYLLAKEPELKEQVKVLQRSQPFGIPPVVVSTAIAPSRFQQLQGAMLAMHTEPEGRAILAALRIDRFVVVNDQIYDSIRGLARP